MFKCCITNYQDLRGWARVPNLIVLAWGFVGVLREGRALFSNAPEQSLDVLDIQVWATSQVINATPSAWETSLQLNDGMEFQFTRPSMSLPFHLWY